jgi:hypothetical protein
VESDDRIRLIGEVARRIQALDRDAKRILAQHEDSAARVVTVRSSYEELDGLSVLQDEIFREALRAIEQGLFRAAHVLAFAAFMDWFHRWLWDGHADNLTTTYPKWGLREVEDLREQSDHQLFAAGYKIGAYRKSIQKSLQGLLHRRNECAHPSDYFPDANQALGYVGEIFKTIRRLKDP